MSSPTPLRRRAQAVLRKQEALRLFIEGKTREEIALEIGVKVGTVDSYIAEGLKVAQVKFAEDADTYRRLTLYRLERLISFLWPNASSGDATSVERIRSLMQDQIKLVGADRPSTTISVSGSITHTYEPREVTEILAILNDAGALKQLPAPSSDVLEGELVRLPDMELVERE